MLHQNRKCIEDKARYSEEQHWKYSLSYKKLSALPKLIGRAVG